jgi:hypothetical protein
MQALQPPERAAPSRPRIPPLAFLIGATADIIAVDGAGFLEWYQLPGTRERRLVQEAQSALARLAGVED